MKKKTTESSNLFHRGLFLLIDIERETTGSSRQGWNEEIEKLSYNIRDILYSVGKNISNILFKNSPDHFQPDRIPPPDYEVHYLLFFSFIMMV